MRTTERIASWSLIALIVLSATSAVAAQPKTTITVAFWGSDAEYTDIWLPIEQAFEARYPEIARSMRLS